MDGRETFRIKNFVQLPFDVEKISGSLRRVLHDEGLKRDLRQKGPDRAKAFSAKEMALSTLKLR